MNVSLTPELDRFVQKLTESGRFASASEVIRAGLRLLSDQEHERESRRKAVRAWIRESLDDPRPNLSEGEILARVEARLSKPAARGTK
ncbi:MAG TPA: type II toxin-antitoxin system ParD family antitoxin [Candidatus Cybelea sp.]|jgi:antitoxin ParD1/3/4